MRNAKAKVHALIDEMPSTAVGAVLQLLTAFKPGGDLDDVDGEVKPRSRRRRAAADVPVETKTPRRGRRAAAKDEDDEDAKPVRRRGRRSAKTEDEDDFEATLEGMDAFMNSVEVEPVEGSVKELRAGLAEYGIDANQLVDAGASLDEKKEEFGVALAAMNALFEKLVACDKPALAELALDVGADTARSNKVTAMNILVAFNQDEEADEDEDEDADEEDTDEDEEEAAPKRRRRRAKVETDEDEDEEEAAPRRRRRSAKADDEDDGDLADLDDEVKSTRRRRRANV